MVPGRLCGYFPHSERGRSGGWGLRGPASQTLPPWGVPGALLPLTGDGFAGHPELSGPLHASIRCRKAARMSGHLAPGPLRVTSPLGPPLQAELAIEWRPTRLMSQKAAVLFLVIEFMVSCCSEAVTTRCSKTFLLNISCAFVLVCFGFVPPALSPPMAERNLEWFPLSCSLWTRQICLLPHFHMTLSVFQCVIYLRQRRRMILHAVLCKEPVMPWLL